MEKTGQPVEEYLAGVTPAKRRADAERLIPLFTRVTGQPAEMWGTIVGFGQYHYRYASGHEGDAPAAGFAARKAATRSPDAWNSRPSRTAATSVSVSETNV